MSWTDEQLAALDELWRRGLTTKEIARELGRTHSSVRAYIADNRARFGYRTGRPYSLTKQEYAIAKRLWANGRTVKQIAARLGRSERQISSLTCHHRRDFPYKYDISGIDWVPEAIRMHELGADLKEIAARCGVNTWVVARRLKLAGHLD